MVTSVFFKHRPDDPPIGAYKRNDCFERIISLEESVTDTATIFEVGDIVEIVHHFSGINIMKMVCRQR